MDHNLEITPTELKKPATSKYSKEFKVKAAIFLAGVSGISAIVGFSATVASAKKQDPVSFGKGILATREIPESGASLALRALGWGSLYAFTGCGILFYTIWKLSGAKNFEEFRYTMGSILPKIPKKDPPRGRTEFSGLNDLLDYLQHLKSSKDE